MFSREFLFSCDLLLSKYTELFTKKMKILFKTTHDNFRKNLMYMFK